MLKASSLGDNVDKGSRQNGSVTLEERVAREIGIFVVNEIYF